MSQDKIEGQEPDTFDGGIAPEGELETAAQREDEREERLEEAPEAVSYTHLRAHET